MKQKPTGAKVEGKLLQSVSLHITGTAANFVQGCFFVSSPLGHNYYRKSRNKTG
jgi:hypothetical protein